MLYYVFLLLLLVILKLCAWSKLKKGKMIINCRALRSLASTAVHVVFLFLRSSETRRYVVMWLFLAVLFLLQKCSCSFILRWHSCSFVLYALRLLASTVVHYLVFLFLRSSWCDYFLLSFIFLQKRSCSFILHWHVCSFVLPFSKIRKNQSWLHFVLFIKNSDCFYEARFIRINRLNHSSDNGMLI